MINASLNLGLFNNIESEFKHRLFLFCEDRGLLTDTALSVILSDVLEKYLGKKEDLQAQVDKEREEAKGWDDYRMWMYTAYKDKQIQQKTKDIKDLIDVIEGKLFTHMFDPERGFEINSNIELVIHGRGHFFEKTFEGQSPRHIMLHEVLDEVDYNTLEKRLEEIINKISD